MEFQLRNIIVNTSKKGDSLWFTADLYIDGRRAALASNDGSGANTTVDSYHRKGQKLVEQAEDFCNSLPNHCDPNIMVNGQPLTMPKKLIFYIDDLVHLSLRYKGLSKDRKISKQFLSKRIKLLGLKNTKSNRYFNPPAVAVSIEDYTSGFKWEKSLKKVRSLAAAKKIVRRR